MWKERVLKKVFKNTPEGKRSVGKPRMRWLHDVENSRKKMGVKGWTKIAKDRNALKLVLKEARVLHGQQDQWKDRESQHCPSTTKITMLPQDDKKKTTFNQSHEFGDSAQRTKPGTPNTLFSDSDHSLTSAKERLQTLIPFRLQMKGCRKAPTWPLSEKQQYSVTGSSDTTALSSRHK
jgi:hypothetical protein